MISHTSTREEAKLEAMQRVWQIRRGGSSTTSLFEEVNETEDVFAPPRQATRAIPKCQYVAPPPPTYSCIDVDSDNETWDFHEQVVPKPAPVEKVKESYLILDASTIGDIPAKYKICTVEPYQCPVIGVYVDKRVIPGFKYRVRPLPSIGKKSTVNACLFDDKALTLRTIGRGYARRFTFEAEKNKLNSNDNYFWSDNRPEGYAFELVVLSEGEKFTIFDINKEAQGTLEILKIEEPQLELSSNHVKNGIEKRAKVKFIGKVEFYETGVAKPLPISGTVIAVKPKGKPTAHVLKVINVGIQKHRYYLVPGIDTSHRRVTVRGIEINDVPTKYTMTGLRPYEIPVVGTYVDPRVIPGFSYKVRPNDRKEHLFDGRALKLMSIGMGYAKRLTFEPDSLVEPNNYLWSDNHPDGLGLEPRAIDKGMQFIVKAGDQSLGEAKVFRADRPQMEEKMEKIKTPTGYAVQKYIHIDVMCHVRLARTGGASTENEEHLMRIYGLAVVKKVPKTATAHVIRVENIGLDSQLNVLFAQTHTELTLIPKH